MAPTISNPAQGGMFHTFQGVTPRKPVAEHTETTKASTAGVSKRITTPHACAECKRRKIRCDGQQPCGQCLSSRAPKRCFYDKHRQRVIPSRKTLETLSQSLEECRSILKRLFPTHEFQSLLPLSRQQLVNLVDRPTIDTSCGGLPSPPLQASPCSLELQSPACTELSESVLSLEQIPTRELEWDEERREREPIPMEADDVNALSLSMDRQASYLGASSIKAALTVMLKVQPQLRSALAAPLDSAEEPHNFPAIRAKCSQHSDPQPIPWSWKGQTLIDAYFKRIHVFIPMLDETSFRADYLEGQRFDAPWLGLLNMVFAMGSISAGKSEDHHHYNYYSRAMDYLPMDALGSSHIETLQALALIGGFYLHYINRPNMANAILGGAVRMASALGLHREAMSATATELAAAETGRRTWWSLFCLDTWATTTLGRPSFGRLGPAINIREPDFGIGAARDSAQHVGSLPLIENIKFCKIATAIQDMLAVTPLLRTEDRLNLDGQLVAWYNNLPCLLRTSDPCAEPIYLARCVMKWRYQNLRMLLHRPVLLTLAASGAQQASEADLHAVEICRELSRQTIEDIAHEWTRNQMSGWNAAWFLYQAAMVPLVSSFWQWDSPRVSEWHSQIETILELLESMQDWSLAARRSREVVLRVYEASRTLMTDAFGGIVGGGGGGGPAPDTPVSMQSSQQLVQEHILAMNAASGELSSPTTLGMDGSEVSGSSVMGMLDHQGLWDLEGMYWSPVEEMGYDPYAAAGAAAMTTADGAPHAGHMTQQQQQQHQHAHQHQHHQHQHQHQQAAAAHAHAHPHRAHHGHDMMGYLNGHDLLSPGQHSAAMDSGFVFVH